MPSVYINIGSNKGHRHAAIEHAVALISKAYPESTIRRSAFIETEPWGYDSCNMYLNLGIAMDFTCMPDIDTLLSDMQGIEAAISPLPHRNPDGSYRDRSIDIDIIAADTMRIDTPRLTLPHPRASLRDFVMIPLRQLAPCDIVDFVQKG